MEFADEDWARPPDKPEVVLPCDTCKLIFERMKAIYGENEWSKEDDALYAAHMRKEHSLMI